jgi:hypothetical protein
MQSHFCISDIFSWKGHIGSHFTVCERAGGGTYMQSYAECFLWYGTSAAHPQSTVKTWNHIWWTIRKGVTFLLMMPFQAVDGVPSLPHGPQCPPIPALIGSADVDTGACSVGSQEILFKEKTVTQALSFQPESWRECKYKGPGSPHSPHTCTTHVPEPFMMHLSGNLPK